LWAKVSEISSHIQTRGFLSQPPDSVGYFFLEKTQESFFILKRNFYLCIVPKEGQTPNKKNLEKSQKSFFILKRIFYFS
jgi:hypothetical protein